MVICSAIGLTHVMSTEWTLFSENVLFVCYLVHSRILFSLSYSSELSFILFLELHKEPLLENLLAEFRTRHPLLEFPPVPPRFVSYFYSQRAQWRILNFLANSHAISRGELDLDVIQKSPYFFHWQTKRQPTSSHTYEYLSSKSSKDDECLRVLHWYSHYPLETFAEVKVKERK